MDYYEAILTGDFTELSGYAGSENNIGVTHLTSLDKSCFDSLEISSRLQAEKAVIHFHTVTSIEHTEKIETLKRLSRSASEKGITLCLVNTEESPETFMEIFNQLPELGFCLDVGHTNLFSNDPVDFIETFSDRLEHIHVHDNKGGDSEQCDLHLPIGKGNLDFNRILSKLNAFGYNDSMTLELHPRFDTSVKIDNLIKIKTMLSK